MEVVPSKFSKVKLLEDKYALVTGAGFGIGRQIAYTLAEQGCRVAVFDVLEEKAMESTSMIADEFGKESARAYVVDVGDAEAMNKTFSELSEWTGGRLDIVVSNAGINRPYRIVDTIANQGNFDLTMRVNVSGTLNCAALAYPLLKKGTDPTFIAVGSCAAQGSEGQVAYAVSKAALRGFVGTAVKEWRAKEGVQAVRVNLIEPDYIEETGLRSDDYLRALANARGISVEEVSNDSVAKSVPLGREGKLIELAETIVMMSLSTYATGTIWTQSGGKTTNIR